MEKRANIESLYNEMSNLYGDSSEINDSITIPDGSILEFFHSYSIPETYITKNLVTQYRIISGGGRNNSYSLADIYYLSNNIILDEYITALFSQSVKFKNYQLKIYDPSNISVPIFSTKKEYIPGMYGKYPEPAHSEKNYRITLKLKGGETKDALEYPTLWYRDLFLQGIPKSLENWDDPESLDTKPADALRLFIKAFSMVKYKNFGIYCIGGNKGSKNEFLKENLDKGPKVISVVPKGFMGP